MKYLLALTIMFFGLPSWSAGYINNEDRWSKLASPVKYGYASGAFDEIVTLSLHLKDDAEYDAQGYAEDCYKLHLSRCMSARNMTAKKLSELITITYKQHPEKSELSPNIILRFAIVEMCGEPE
jgi:hypothetical protein